VQPGEGTSFDPIRLEHGLDHSLVYYSVAVEAEVEAPIRQAAEELQQRRRISDLRRAEAHGRPAAEDDIGNSLDRWFERGDTHLSEVSMTPPRPASAWFHSEIAD
jgi:hypothetical protein